MAIIAHIYKDAGLTLPFDDAVDTLDAQAINGSNGNGSFWIGTPTAANQIQDATNPGIDQITASIVDAVPASNVEAVHIKLSLTEAGLATAVGGAPLAIAATILGGSANAIRVWYQWDNSIGPGTFTDISLNVTARIEVAI
jgi:hypothetical protein